MPSSSIAKLFAFGGALTKANAAGAVWLRAFSALASSATCSASPVGGFDMHDQLAVAAAQPCLRRRRQPPPGRTVRAPHPRPLVLQADKQLLNSVRDLVPR